MPTPATEDYLKAIYKLLENSERASTNAVADSMRVSAASVTNMMKRLSEMGLVEHQPYQTIRLTEAGRKIALEIGKKYKMSTIFDKIINKEINLKGEFTLIVGNNKRASKITIEDKIRQQTLKILQKYTLTETVEIVHKLSNISKKDIYKMALELKND